MWRLAAVGFDEHGRREDYERVVTPDEWIADVLRGALTVHSTTFTDTDVVQVVAAWLGDGSTVDTVERIADLVLAAEQMTPVTGPSPRVRQSARQRR